MINKYKNYLLQILGTICLIAGLYAPLLSSFLLSKETHDFTNTNFVFIGLGIVFLWGTIVNVAKSLTNMISNKIKK